VTRPALFTRRLAPAAWDRAQAALGGLGYGLDAQDDVLAPAGVPLAPLFDGAPVIDAWVGGPTEESGRTAGVRWRHDGTWLWGALEVDAPGRGLEAPALDAYRRLFATLEATGFPCLQRVWNYLPGINAEGQGSERYREFNAGRQQAFADAGQALGEGVPAACALGTPGGPLLLRFLAGRTPAEPLENPRQVSAWRYPPQYGVRAPLFARAALLDGGRVLVVSGTASIVGHETCHAGDPAAQARETVVNLRAVVEAANARSASRFDPAELDAVVYVRHPEHAEAIRAELEAELGAASRTVRDAAWLQADICRSDLLVEVEGHVVADTKGHDA
jgi:enamine deaminase RidA (YjgF/YER057c/UK114 family)